MTEGKEKAVSVDANEVALTDTATLILIERYAEQENAPEIGATLTLSLGK